MIDPCEGFKSYAIFEFGFGTLIYLCIGLSIFKTKCENDHIKKGPKEPYPGTMISKALKYQYDRRLPLLWYQNQLFWIINLLNYAYIIISCYILNATRLDKFNSSDFIISISRTLLLTVIATISCLKPQDRKEFDEENPRLEHFLDSSNSLRDDTYRSTSQNFWKKNAVSESTKKRTATLSLMRMDKPKPTLSVKVSSKIQQRDDEYRGSSSIEYKLQVKIGSKQYKILKKAEEFKQLENNLCVEGANGTSLNDFNLSNILASDSEDISNVHSIVQNLQAFIDYIIGREQISFHVIKFLEVPEPEATQLNGTQNWDMMLVGRMSSDNSESWRMKKKPDQSANSYVSDEFFEDDDETEWQYDIDEKRLANPSVVSDNDPEVVLIKSVSDISQKLHNQEDEYCTYFQVSITKFRKAIEGDFMEYIIKLKLIEKPDEEWQIIKRYSDFVQLKQKLKEVHKLKSPMLQKKKASQNDISLEDRRVLLERYLRQILNERIYFLPIVFEFIQLNESYYEWVQDGEEYNFSTFKASIDKSQIVMKQGKPYTVYHILIEEKSYMNKNVTKSSHTILRRFKEFEKLQASLQARFKYNPIKLPELPSKTNSMQSKTTVDFRKTGLEKYLNELFLIQGIGDSFEFRKFINFKRKYDSFIGKDGAIEAGSSALNNMLDITDSAIEDKLTTTRAKRGRLESENLF